MECHLQQLQEWQLGTASKLSTPSKYMPLNVSVPLINASIFSEKLCNNGCKLSMAFFPVFTTETTEKELMKQPTKDQPHLFQYQSLVIITNIITS